MSPPGSFPWLSEIRAGLSVIYVWSGWVGRQLQVTWREGSGPGLGGAWGYNSRIFFSSVYGTVLCHLELQQNVCVCMCVCVYVFNNSVVSYSLQPNGQTVSCQAPLSMGFSRQEYWNGVPFPPPGNFPDPGIKPMSLALAGRFFTTEAPGKACMA